MHLRWIVLFTIIVLGQVGHSYCELLSGVLYVCEHHEDGQLANIEVVVEPTERQVVYIHTSPEFKYLRIQAKVTGCMKAALYSEQAADLYSEKILIPGDLGLDIEDSQNLIELSSEEVMGQHVYHVTKIKAQVPDLHNHHHVNYIRSFNDSISMSTGLGCGHIHSYVLQALGATLCTPYRPHHAQEASGDHSFRVYADNSVDDTEELPSLPPHENPAGLKWKPFIPWLLIHYFSLRSWQSRAEGMALVLTLGMYLVYLLFKSRKVIRLYTSQEQERVDERVV